MQNNFDQNEYGFLSVLMQHEPLHARFLNTLAFMELCGAQQISRALRVVVATTELLEHVNEEYRHAYFLRKLAQKISPSSPDHFTKDSVFCMRVSRNYVVQLQRRIALILAQQGFRSVSEKTYAQYCMTTFAIEQRALPFYQNYDALLSRHQICISVKSIISEEASHLAYMRQHLAKLKIAPAIIEPVVVVERELFSAWLKSLKHEIVRAYELGEV